MLPDDGQETGTTTLQNLRIVPHEMQAASCFHADDSGDDRSMIILTPQLVAAFAALLPGLAALVWACRRKP